MAISLTKDIDNLQTRPSLLNLWQRKGLFLRIVREGVPDDLR